jgi:hypothetical protein
MSKNSRYILLFVLLGITFFQFAPLLDDPQHFVEADPDCPFCLATKTELCTTPVFSISFTSEVIVFLVESAPCNLGSEDCLPHLKIRAPPPA